MGADLVRAQFDHGYWATSHILTRAGGLSDEEFRATPGSTRDLRGTLVHALDTEWSWRLRLQGEPAEVWTIEMTSEEFPDVEGLKERWGMDENEMRAWLSGLTDADLMGLPDMAEESKGYPLAYYLLHILNHSAQCRADAAAFLTDLGHSPGDLDFLDWADSIGADSTR